MAESTLTQFLNEKQLNISHCNTCPKGAKQLFLAFQKLFLNCTPQSLPESLLQYIPVFNFILKNIVSKGFLLSSSLRKNLNNVKNNCKNAYVKKCVKILSVIGVQIDNVNEGGINRNIIHCQYFNLSLFNYFNTENLDLIKKIKKQETEIQNIKKAHNEYQEELKNLNIPNYMKKKYSENFIATCKKIMKEEGDKLRAVQMASSSVERESDFSLPQNELTSFLLTCLKPRTFNERWWEMLENGEDIVAISKICKLFDFFNLT